MNAFDAMKPLRAEQAPDDVDDVHATAGDIRPLLSERPTRKTCVPTVEPQVPAAFSDESYHLLQEGVFDDPDVDVLINESGDFAVLHPQPSVNYERYVPRVEKLSLLKYKRKQGFLQRRYEKLTRWFPQGPFSMLEIGASDGSFLRIVQEQHPTSTLAAVEPDQSTLETRQEVVDGHTYDSLAEAREAGAKFDCIGFFHVIEHITETKSFLSEVRQLAKPNCQLFVEAPSLTEPLYSLYHCDAHRRFYFQKQHPYVYSHSSLKRLMEENGFKTDAVLSHQRYGLENHLNWLVNRQPGGNDQFRRLFEHLEESYVQSLEHADLTDSVIWIGTVANR